MKPFLQTLGLLGTGIECRAPLRVPYGTHLLTLNPTGKPDVF
jgi:hypothetical protein